MEPPPPSLEAMVQSTARFRRKEPDKPPWLLWIAVVVLAAGLTFYVTR